ncbi:signal peptidase I [Spirillospora sp. CA-294931]|uniref:signal peptidase I n=1 Tax=Spirillospora sp. CA-294931 TaxID=3240042 RepID=UPI003D8C31B0
MDTERQGTSPEDDHDGPRHAAGWRRRRTRKRRPFWKELPVLLGLSIVLALLIKVFVVQAFYIPSESMQDTLRVGDRLLVNKVVYRTRDVRRGEVVVFKGPDSWNPEVTYDEPSNPVSRALRAVGGWFGVAPGEKDYIKRVIGVGGDRVRCAGKGAPVTVNGRPLKEDAYLAPGSEPSESEFDITVPKGRLWVMGDNRGSSSDSRAHQAEGDGTIPEDAVIGRAFAVIWPFGHWTGLPVPETFDQPGLAALALLPFWPRRRGKDE